jgi:glycosyltransferase involved in cell wall biosynthesis
MSDVQNSLVKRMIRVLILVDGMPGGGAERQIVLLLKGLCAYRQEIQSFFGVLAKGGEREEEARRWANQVLQIKQRHPLDITMAWSVQAMVTSHHIDIVHSFGSISDVTGIVAGKMTGCKTIVGSIRSARKKLSRRDLLSRFAMRFADVVVANSQAGLRAFGLENEQKSMVIGNGLDLTDIECVEPYHHQAPYVLMVGNFTGKKDHPALINAFPEVLKQLPGYHLLLVGKGPRVKSCCRLVAQLGLMEQVSFITDCNNPASYIKGAEVCVLLSSDGEGISNVLLEYCALNRPVIASDMGGNPEIVSNRESGLLLQSHKPGSRERGNYFSAARKRVRQASCRVWQANGIGKIQPGKNDIQLRLPLSTSRLEGSADRTSKR